MYGGRWGMENPSKPDTYFFAEERHHHLAESAVGGKM